MTLQTYTTSGQPRITCAKYGVMIVDRHTRATVVRLPERGWDLTYDYRIDRTSEATLEVNVAASGVDSDCCERLGQVGHWMHDLVVYREGSNKEVWGGPVTGLRDAPGKGRFTVRAKDRSAWWWRRAITRDLVYSGGARADATRVFMDLLREAEQTGGTASWVLPYDPVRLNVSGRETAVEVDGKVLTASEIIMVGPEIESLADSVIDWTVIGRTCYVGSLVIELDPLPILAQDHWLELDPEIDWDGENVATKVVVLGARGIRGEYPIGHIDHPRWPQYGSHITRISDPKITDQGVANERARTLWELNQQPALCVLSTGGSLGPNAPVIPSDLVPGRLTRVGFDTSCFITSNRLAQTRENGVLQYVAYDSGTRRDLVVPQRITKTTVHVSDSEEQAVLVDLQPPGTDVMRRPGGRSNRQPTHDITEPPPDEVTPCCKIWFAAEMVPGGGALLYDGGEVSPAFHPGACRDEYYVLQAPGDSVEVQFGLETQNGVDCMNLLGRFNEGSGEWEGPFAIVGQQVTEGSSVTMQLEINGFSYTLYKDNSGQSIAGLIFPQRLFTWSWQFAYYNANDIAADHPFVLGGNTIRLTLLTVDEGAESGTWVEVEQFIIGQDGAPVSADTDECLQLDDSDEDFVTCYECHCPSPIFES